VPNPLTQWNNPISVDPLGFNAASLPISVHWAKPGAPAVHRGHFSVCGIGIVVIRTVRFYFGLGLGKATARRFLGNLAAPGKAPWAVLACVLAGALQTPLAARNSPQIGHAIPDAPDGPSAEIGNHIVQTRLYLPDPQRGYQRATRFDWSGIIADVRVDRHSYSGLWFEKYDPKRHDSISGPVQEFVSDQS